MTSKSMMLPYGVVNNVENSSSTVRERLYAVEDTQVPIYFEPAPFRFSIPCFSEPLL